MHFITWGWAKLITLPQGLFYAFWGSVIALILLIMATVWGKRKTSANRAKTYESRHFLCTPTETKFFFTLHEAVNEHYYIFSKVRIADVIQVNKSLNQNDPNFWKVFNKISGKHVDFVLCHKKNLAIVCAVELDDASHQRGDRKARDKFVNATFAEAGIALVHIPVQASYALEELKQLLHPNNFKFKKTNRTRIE